jgi:sugar phosphate isomerase/epimerase
MTQKNRMSRRELLGTAMKAGVAGVAATQLSRSAGAAEGEAKPYRIGLYTRPWDQYDYRVALDAIAEAGFTDAGLMTTKSDTRLVISAKTTPEEAQAVDAECKQRKLHVPSVYGGGIPVKESLEAGIAGLRKLIDNCAIVKADNLLMGGVGEDLHEPYYKAIAECCDYAAEKNVGISVKPHGGSNANAAQCRKIVESVNHDNFRIWFDPGNTFYYSDGALDPVDDAATVDGLVVGMCIKDFLPPKNVMVTPGDGQVDFPKVLARLQQGGFKSGALVIECLSKGDEAHLIGEAKKARAFVEGLV